MTFGFCGTAVHLVVRLSARCDQEEHNADQRKAGWQSDIERNYQWDTNV